MYKIFYLFRHGETNYNIEKRWQGCSIDAPLNDNGMAQARLLADKLQDLGIKELYSSRLKRAVQTAGIVSEKLNVPINYITDLREGNLGQAEGRIYSDVEQMFPDIFQAWYSPENDMNISFPDGETKQQMQDRMFNVFQRLLKSDADIVGVCSHGSSIRYLLMKFGIMPHRMPNTALYKIIYDSGQWSAEKLF
ncbi:MAG: histidine phosphatase family protein [Alphaproteobacteria bacterium]|nr:histidine phosphatase family protein [Alphaproteobacteria bacterium]